MSSSDPIELAPQCQGPDCTREATRPAAYSKGEPSAFCRHCWQELTAFHRAALVVLYRHAQRWEASAARIPGEIQQAVQYLTRRKEPK